MKVCFEQEEIFSPRLSAEGNFCSSAALLQTCIIFFFFLNLKGKLSKNLRKFLFAIKKKKKQQTITTFIIRIFITGTEQFHWKQSIHTLPVKQTKISSLI